MIESASPPPPTLLLAPAGAGKTEFLLQHIRALKEAEPFAAALVLVPNQLQAGYFQQRLANSGGAFGVEVQTFYQLYADLLARAGKPLAALLDPVQTRLLRWIVDDLCRRGQMRYYAPLQTRPGLIVALREVLQELKRARCLPENFAAAVQGRGPRLEELASVYTAYQTWLQRQNWADQEGRGWLAALALEQNPALGRHLRLLAVSGFDEFNPTQLSVLKGLSQRAAETVIALTGEIERSKRPAHSRFSRARKALEEELRPRTENLPAGAYLSPALAHLEMHLFEEIQEIPGPQPEIEMVEAQTRAAEARAALRWAKRLIVRQGLHPQQIAILARDIEAYRPFLSEIAAEFGLPLHLSGGLPLAQNPAAAALMALLALPAQDWPRRPLLEAWLSPYFDWSGLGLSAADAAALDALARQQRVSGGLVQWREALAAQAAAQPAPQITDDEDGAFGPALTPTPELSVRFEAFCTLLTPPAAGQVSDYVAFIEDLVGSDMPADEQSEPGVGLIARLRSHPPTAERDLAAMQAFKDVLRGLVLAESALGSPPGDYAAFYEDLRGAVEATNYRLRVQGGLLAASVLDGRGLSFQAVALLGLSEGEFPRPQREDPFLSDDDRKLLHSPAVQLELRLRSDEECLFYQALTRSRRRLLLTRPYLADDGQKWEESPYWQQVWALLGKPKPQTVRPEEPVAPAEAASPGELWSSEALAAHNPELAAQIGRGRAVLQARLARAGESDYEGQLNGLAAALAERYGPGYVWSASKLEAYGACPFYFYTAYALDLQPLTPPEEGYDVRALGSMLHKVLEETYRQASDPTDLAACLAQMAGIADQVFAAAPAEYGFRPGPLWAQQQQELRRVLERTIAGLAEASQGFTPHHLEQTFGFNGRPELEIRDPDTPGPAGAIRLHGYIDRVDADANGQLRVIDYKAGGAAINARDLEAGRRLQLPLYALAAQQALNLGTVRSGFYWHLQKAEASSLKLEEYTGGVEAAFQTAVTHTLNHVANIRAGHFRPQPPAGGCPSYCPAVAFCWKYHPKGF